MADGVILTLASDLPIPASSTAVDWDSEQVIGGSSLWSDSPDPSRITIDDSLDNVVGELFCWVRGNAGTTRLNGFIMENGTEIAKQVIHGYNDESFSLATGVIKFSAGDYYEVFLDCDGSLIDLDAAQACFALVTTERTGFVSAIAEVDSGAPATELVVWTDPVLDTLSTWDGTSGFTAPIGTVAAIVSLNNYNTAGPDFGIEWFCRVAGTDVRTTGDPGGSGRFAHGPADFGVVPITGGQKLEIRRNSSAPIQADECRLGIEWIRS